jgi:hypothetical protein
MSNSHFYSRHPKYSLVHKVWIRNMTWLALTLFILPGLLQAQCLPIPEAVAKGSTGGVASAPSGIMPTVDEVLSRADLVVVGTVGSAQSYISENQCYVYTDLALTDTTIVHSRFPLLTPPNSKPSLTVTQLGGTVSVNGVTFTEIQRALAPLKPGQRVLLLLKRKDNKLMIADMFLGAFAIEDDKVTPLMVRDDYAPDYRHIPLAEATERMKTILRQQDALRAAATQQQR